MGPGLLPHVRRWWWLLLACSLVGALGAWVVASSATKTYEAEAKLLVGPVSGDYPTLQAAGALGRTYAELAHSRRVVAAHAGPSARRSEARPRPPPLPPPPGEAEWRGGVGVGGGWARREGNEDDAAA